MSRLFDGADDWLTTDAPITNGIGTCVVWFKRQTALAADTLCSVGAAGGAGDSFSATVNANGSTGAVTIAAGSSNGAASTTVATDLTAWHVACARFTSAALREAFLDGVGKGAQTSSRTVAGVNTLRIGASLDGIGRFTGYIAHVAWWNIALSDADVLLLKTKLPDQVQPSALVFYAPLILNRTPEIDDRGGLELIISGGAVFSSDNPPIGPPYITTVGTMRDGASLTINGFVFKPTGVAPTVTIGGIAQTLTGSTDTQLTLTVALGTMKYGDQAIVVTNSLGLSDSFSAPLLPPTGWAYVDLVALVPPEQRLTALTDLQAGHQVAYGNVIGAAVTTGAVLADGSWFWPAAVTAFDAKANDGTSYGASATEQLADPIAVPVLVGAIPNFVIVQGQPVQLNVALYATGWASLTLVGSLPAGLINTAGIITGTVPTLGSTQISVIYTNAAGGTQSAPFTITVVSSQFRRRDIVTTRRPLPRFSN